MKTTAAVSAIGVLLEGYLFLFSVYLLGVGLFVERLTQRWLWTAFGLGLSGLIFSFSSFKNLVVFDFSWGINFGSLLWLALLGGLTFGIWSVRANSARDLLGWFSLGQAQLSLTQLGTGDFSSFAVDSVPLFWSGHIQGGALSDDFRSLAVLAAVGVFVGVMHRGFVHYEYDYAVLVLLGLLSSLLLFSSDNLILIYLNLEFQALILYVVVTYYRFEETATEAGLKYLLVGSVVSGFFLLGSLSFYFDQGSFNLAEAASPEGQTWLVANLLFKLGVFPFYFWTPSVYQEVDLPTLIFVGILPKVSIWFLFLTVFQSLVDRVSSLYWLGLFSMVVGGLGGLYQSSLGSIVAYSGVLNGGYLLLLSDRLDLRTSFAAGIYLAGYYLVLTLLLCGLSHDRPDRRLKFLWYYLLLSLAGLPVLPGFALKVYLLGTLLESNFVEVGLVVFFSLFGLVYYLRLAGVFLFLEEDPSQQEFHPVYLGGLVILGSGIVQTVLNLV